MAACSVLSRRKEQALGLSAGDGGEHVASQMRDIIPAAVDPSLPQVSGDPHDYHPFSVSRFLQVNPCPGRRFLSAGRRMLLSARPNPDSARSRSCKLYTAAPESLSQIQQGCMSVPACAKIVAVSLGRLRRLCLVFFRAHLSEDLSFSSTARGFHFLIRYRRL